MAPGSNLISSEVDVEHDVVFFGEKTQHQRQRLFLRDESRTGRHFWWTHGC